MLGKRKPISEEQARLKLADLCVRSEQCESDLITKLRGWGLFPDRIESIIRDLKRDKFLDNARFARAYARDKARFARWGRRKIRMGLLAKRISPTDIGKGLDAIEETDYLDSLESAAIAKSRSLDLSVREDVRKLYVHLLSRGYEPDLISKTIGRLRKNGE